MRRPSSRFASIAMTAVMAGSMLLSGIPAHAAAATSISDTMSRVKQSEAAVTHVLRATIPSASWDNSTLVTIVATYTGFTAFATTPDCVVGTGTCTAAVSGANVLTLTCTAAACSGALVVGGVTPWTGTNPSSEGSYPVSFTGSSSVNGSFAIPVTSEDQIQVTATVAPYMTFQVNTDHSGANASCTHGTDGSSIDHAPNYDGGTVELGTLSPLVGASSDTARVGSSDDAFTPGTAVQHICTFVSTNAGYGYAITVQSTNGKIVSTGTPADAIPTVAQTIGSSSIMAGTSRYLMCLSTANAPNLDSTSPAGNNFTGASPFNPGTCVGSTADGDLGGKLTTDIQTIGSAPGGVQEGAQQWLIKASITATTKAHTDYADTLTFIATGTF